MRVLVTGPDGFVGSAVCRRLLEDGLAVRGAQWKASSRGQTSEVGGRQTGEESGTKNEERGSKNLDSIVVGDINADTDWATVLQDVDAVVHLAARVHVMDETAEDPLSAFRAVNVEGTRRLAQEAARAGVKRFVFVSSIKVNGEETGDRRPEVGVGDRGSAFSEKDTPAPEDPYGVSKWEAEQRLRKIEADTGMEVVVLRPPLIYGPGVKANFLKLVQAIDRGIPLPLGMIQNRRSLMGLTNLADLIVRCVADARAAGQTFTVSDGDDVSSAELARRIAAALRKKPRLLPVPGRVLKLAGKLSGKSAQVDRLCSSLVIDSSHLRQTLAWSPPFTMEQELTRTAEWFRRRGECGSQKSEVMKRCFDILTAFLALVVFSPLFLLCALAVKLTSRGPVFYVSDRIGAHNTHFNMLKFRTMRTDTPQLATHLMTDPKVFLTPIGGFLRKTSLDELPQLINVLKGDMSIVGPRPALFNQDDQIALRTESGAHVLTPGITGWAQINGRDDIPIARKVELDTWYLHNRSFVLDLRIIWLTVWNVVSGSGVRH